MFEQEVPAEGKLELNVFACRGDIEVLGHDAPDVARGGSRPADRISSPRGKATVLSWRPRDHSALTCREQRS